MNCNYTSCVKEGSEDGVQEYELDGQRFFYCDDHAIQKGFCPGCGGFFAGIESFEFPKEGQVKGYCQDCSDRIFDETDDDEEDEVGDDSYVIF